MSVSWLWKDKMGSVQWTEHGATCTVDIYDGNCLCVFIHRYICGDRKMYDFYGFINNLDHLKNCIGITKGQDNMYRDIWSNIKLNTYYKQSLKMAKWLTKAGFTVTLYYRKPE